MRVVTAPIILLIAPLALLTACRGGGDDETPLTVDAVGPAAAQAILAEAQSAGLTARDAAGQVVPGLARSWRVADDGLSIVFRLREAHFPGGRRIDSSDVAATIERARRGDAGALTRALLTGVTEVNAPLPDVVELELSTPQPELIELLATPPLSVRPANGRSTAIGPYRLEPAVAGDPLRRLTRNPDYFAAASVIIPTVQVATHSADDAIQRFNRGETLLVQGGGLDGFASARVAARRNMLVPSVPRATLMLLVNHKSPKLADQRVRRALMLAIDRVALGPALFGTQAARPLTGLTPPSIEGWPTPAPAWASQPLVARQEEARRLLVEAGADHLAGRLRLEVLAGQDAGSLRLIERVAADLAAVGVDLVLLRAVPVERARRLAGGDFELALVRRDSPIQSVVPFLQPLRCGENKHGVCLPEADKLLDASWKAPTLAERVTALATAERLWADDGAAIALVQPIDWAMVSPRIDGFAANAAGVHPLQLMQVGLPRSLLAGNRADDFLGSEETDQPD